MSDLIERQAAINTAQVMYERCDENIEDYRDLMVESLKVLPSAQPEIIRCKDCKHYVIHTFFGRSQGWCERLCDEFDKSLARGTEADDYCSRAERREDG